MASFNPFFNVSRYYDLAPVVYSLIPDLGFLFRGRSVHNVISAQPIVPSDELGGSAIYMPIGNRVRQLLSLECRDRKVALR